MGGEGAESDLDPASLNFVELKRWLVGKGCPPSKLKGKFTRDDLFLMIPDYEKSASADDGDFEKNKCPIM